MVNSSANKKIIAKSGAIITEEHKTLLYRIKSEDKRIKTNSIIIGEITKSV